MVNYGLEDRSCGVILMVLHPETMLLDGGTSEKSHLEQIFSSPCS